MSELKKEITKYWRLNYGNEEYNDDDMEAVYRVMHDIASYCGLVIDFDFVDGGDCYVYATVYVPDMIGEGKSYNVIIEIEVRTYGFEADEDFIDYMLKLNSHGQKILDYFKEKNATM